MYISTSSCFQYALGSDIMITACYSSIHISKRGWYSSMQSNLMVRRCCYCSKAKLFNVKSAEKVSTSQKENRNFSRKKVSPTSRRNASPAVTHVKTAEEVPVKCLTLSALPAEQTAKFPSNREMTVLYIAAIVFLTRDKRICIYEKMHQLRSWVL